MKESINADYYRRRLEKFLRERHPRLADDRELIHRRSTQAAGEYNRSIEQGESPLLASCRADEKLYGGLIFSRFDTLRCILATEYP